jgi:hypothetical protein
MKEEDVRRQVEEKQRRARDLFARLAIASILEDARRRGITLAPIPDTKTTH